MMAVQSLTRRCCSNSRIHIRLSRELGGNSRNRCSSRHDRYLSCLPFLATNPTRTWINKKPTARIFNPFCFNDNINGTTTPTTAAAAAAAVNNVIFQTIQRTFALKRGKKKLARAKTNNTNTPEANEDLVASIMELKMVRSADNVKVRIIPDPLVSRHVHNHTNEESDEELVEESGENKKETKPKVIVVSLAEAIQMAIDQEKDLVAISVQQEIPVLTLCDYQSLLYHAEKSTKRRTQTKVGSVMKEAVLKVGIADNDLHRKLDDVIGFLEKGHNVQITVKAPARQLRQNSMAVSDMIGRVAERLTDHAEFVQQPIVQAEERQGRFVLKPKK